jgi:subtilase family serine protease
MKINRVDPILLSADRSSPKTPEAPNSKVIIPMIVYNSLWQQAVAEGQTPIVAAGDSADDVCDRGDGRGPNGQDVGVTGLSVSGMASTPYNVAAGGTDFSDNYQTGFRPTQYWNNNDTSPYGSALSYIPEMAWNNTCASTILVDAIRIAYGINYTNGPEGLCNDYFNFGDVFTNLDGGSGGISSLYSRPPWQSVYGVGLSGNFTSTSNRNLPDVSLFASSGLPWYHMLVYCESDVAPCDYSDPDDVMAMAAGGTSFVAPMVNGILGLINQAWASRQGQANYTFYALAAQEYGTPSAPNTSTTAPSLYTCEGSNVNAISTYGGIFRNCIFYNT